MYILIAAACTADKPDPTTASLKDAFSDKFYIGAALSEKQITGKDSAGVALVKSQFNAIVAENCMKSGPIQPAEGEFNFSLADQFVDFGEKNNLFVTGHTLVWHSQAPGWFFTDSSGNDVSREVLIERMKRHISTVAGRYKGRVKGWDVVNEVIMDDGSWRFYEIIGEDFVKIAFETAHAADPAAELYYNDYSMSLPAKRNGVVEMVKNLQQQGVRIDGIGMQGHLDLHADLSEFERSLLAFAGLGVKVMVTELDVSVLPSPWRNAGADVARGAEYELKMNPYREGLPDSVNVAFSRFYADFFKLMLKHQDKISRVTFWGLSDGDSWKNNWPIRGRTDYPLLFDRNHQPKQVVEEIIKAANDPVPAEI